MPHDLPLSELAERIQLFPPTQELLPKSIEFIADGSQDLDVTLENVANYIVSKWSLVNLAVISGSRGRWDLLGSAKPASFEEGLLSEALDENRVVQSQGISAVPLSRTSQRGELLVVVANSSLEALQVESLAGLVGFVLRIGRELRQKDRRLRRQQAILGIAAQWNQTQELVPLLEHMAEASTSLINAERASIFLWDKPNRTLIGRPALGVDTNELQIPDTTGIVGQVVQTGEVRRVDLDTREQQAIDRKVDQELGFETKTLLCAPLLHHGKILGAFEVINKIGGNFDSEDEADLIELAGQAAVALSNTQHIEKLLRKQQTLVNQAAAEVQMIGECAAMLKLTSTIERVADTELSVLILGENGTGKEVAGQMLHYLSNRRQDPLVTVNCAAITESLLESELFGHEKGAFTDAHETRAGKFELAAGGTLFLDEIGDMSLAGQAKLLRVLEEKVVVRVGGSTPIPADVRIVAATNQNLTERVREKKFREDLFFRLTVVTIDMPPLRDRANDILLLAEFFLKNFCQQAKRSPPTFSPAARKLLLNHSWPGNVRELRNMMERVAYLSKNERIDNEDLHFILTAPIQSESQLSLDLNLAEATRDFQLQFIEKQIHASRGNMTEAAKKLGLHRSNLYRKMRQLGMDCTEEE
ncbi:MAG: sigma-54-dependent Fis family transcriptional regulator [Planctomycetota bacterium]|nr:sigma-54-dependent Fis family transcriptional regulator [Planctomycetota bacterium]